MMVQLGVRRPYIRISGLSQPKTKINIAESHPQTFVKSCELFGDLQLELRHIHRKDTFF